MPVLAGEDGTIRIDLSFPHEGRWRVKNVDFYHGDERIEGILPSEHFTSAWMSEGAEDEWIMVDLGTVRKVDSVPHVILSAPCHSERSEESKVTEVSLKQGHLERKTGNND